MYTPPFPIVSTIANWGIVLLIVAIFVRMLASWVRLDESVPFILFLARITDPFIVPCRRIVGQVALMDLSYLTATFLLFILRILLLQSLPTGW